LDEFTQRTLKILRQSAGPLRLAELMRRMDLKSAHRRQLKGALRALIEAGLIRELANKNYQAGEASARRGQGALVGRLSITSQGFGFVRLETPPGGRQEEGASPDVYVAGRDLGAAMQDDRVAVKILSRRGKNPSGVIVDVLERAHETFTGWFQRSGKRTGRVTPRDPRIGRVVNVRFAGPEPPLADFDWARVKITRFTPAPEPLEGEILERLGNDDTPGIDVLLVLRDRGISVEFPPEVEEEARALQVDWPAEEARRRDLRSWRVVTIDPSTAKDFDDALSLERMDGAGAPDLPAEAAGARWRLGVHIADVAAFVREDGAIDREAFERATSVYPVDRVAPMLPESLSNGLCSLRPGEDRLAFSVEIYISPRGKILHSTMYRSIIHSRHRLTYEEAQAALDGTDPAARARLADVADMLGELRDLTRLLRKRRIERGALDLDIPEVEIVFDAQGRPVDVRHAARLESHQLVEECMLAANEEVARRLTQENVPMVYRVHEAAAPERLERLEPLLRCFGLRASFSDGGIQPRDIQEILAQAEQMPAGHILRRLVLRALARAEYRAENLGHFGLASPCYCHFTSPIRRYPDLIVHRALLHLLESGAPPENEREAIREDLVWRADHCSRRERIAQEIEWDTTKLKALEFMQGHLGEEFDGYVAGVQPFGLFIELEPYPAEGLIPAATLPHDRYNVDEIGSSLVGERRGLRFRLGDRIRARVERINLVNLEMDLAWVPPPGAIPAPRKREGEPSFHERRPRRRGRRF